MKYFTPPTVSQKLRKEILRLSGLVAYYPLDEQSGLVARNRAPSTQNTLNGTISGATVGQSGKVGRAYSFDGTNDYVGVTAASSLQITTNLTLLVWVYLDDWANHASLINKFTDDNHCEYHWRIQQTSGEHYFQEGKTSGNNTYVGTAKLETGVWQQLAVTRDDTNVIMYINGVLDKSTALTGGTIATTAADVNIGRRNDSQLFLKGDLQHCAIFNRALAASELLRLAKISGVA